MHDGLHNEVNTLLTKFLAQENDSVDTKEERNALAREVSFFIYERFDVIETETNLKKPQGQATVTVWEILMISNRFKV